MTHSPQQSTSVVFGRQLALRDHPERHRYTVALGAEGAEAVVKYTRLGDTLLIRHTEVPAHLAGQGVGTAVMRAVFEDARARSLHVTPMCAFSSAFVRRHPEFADLVRPHARAALGLL